MVTIHLWLNLPIKAYISPLIPSFRIQSIFIFYLKSEAKNIREGCVVKPLIERTHPEIGRVQLKLVSNTYLEGKGKRRKKK